MIGYIIIGIVITLCIQALLFVFLGDIVGHFLAELTGFGKETLVGNKDRKFGAGMRYYHTKVVRNGQTIHYLYTPHDSVEMESRAIRNHEDLVL